MSKHFILILLAGTIPWTSWGQTTNTPPPTSATQFINQMRDSLLELNNNTQIDEQTKNHQLCTLMKQAVDLPRMARLSIGFTWKTITAEQKEKFIFLFTEYLLRTFKTSFDKITNKNQLTVLKETSTTRKNRTTYKVNSVITIDTETSLDWAILKTKSGQYKIYNVTLADLSLIINYRNAYLAQQNQTGGSFQDFLDKNEDRLFANGQKSLCPLPLEG